MKKAITYTVSCLIIFSMIGLAMSDVFGQSERVFNLNFTVEEEFSPNSALVDYFIFNGMDMIDQNYSNPFMAKGMNHRMDSVVYEDYHANSASWDASNKSDFRYDARGNVTQFVDYRFVETTGRWDPYQRRTFTYDEKNNVTEFITATYFSYPGSKASKWINKERRAYIYENDGSVRTITTHMWDNVNNHWNPETRVFHKYNDKGDLIETTVALENMPFSKWMDEYRISYTYNEEGLRTHMIYSNWNESGSYWVVDHLVDYMYDAKGNMIEVIGYQAIVEIAFWAIDFKIEYTYDNEGRMSTKVMYGPVNSLSKLSKEYMAEYAYDANGNRTKTVNYKWDDARQMWDGIDKIELVYELNYAANTIMMPHTIFIAGSKDVEHLTGMLVYFTRYYNDKGAGTATIDNWVYDQKGTFHYTSLNVEEAFTTVDLRVDVFPNPITDYVTFKLEDASTPARVQLYDASGKLVLEQDLLENGKVTVDHLISGMYIWNIVQKENMKIGKMMIK